MGQIWQKQISLERLNALIPGTMLEVTQTRFSEFGDDYLCATMPVTNAVRQPAGLLHGGASAALAETVGSVAGFFACPQGCHILGTDISANHLQPMRGGQVVARATPIRLGRLLQLWQIDIHDQDHPHRLICSARHSVIVQRAK